LYDTQFVGSVVMMAVVALSDSSSVAENLDAERRRVIEHARADRVELRGRAGHGRALAVGAAISGRAYRVVVTVAFLLRRFCDIVATDGRLDITAADRRTGADAHLAADELAGKAGRSVTR
jgi:hypothetical protein